MADMRYFLNLITGVMTSAEKGSSFDKQKSSSSDYKAFNSDAERTKYKQEHNIRRK